MKIFWSKKSQKNYEQQLAQGVMKELLEGRQKYWGAVLPWVGPQSRYVSDNLTQLIEEGYQDNPTVYSIINWIVTNATRIPFKVYQGKGDKKQELTDHEILEVFERPNKHQSFAEFFAHVYGFDRTTGNSYVYAPIMDGGPAKGKFIEMHVLPSDEVQIIGESSFEPVGGYEIDGGWGSHGDHFPADEVLHVKTTNLDYESGNQLYGHSPLQAAYKELSKSNENYNAAMKSFQNLGSAGILKDKTIPSQAQMTNDQYDRAQDQMQKYIQGSDNKGKLVYSSLDLELIKFGLSPVDMALLEDQKNTVNTFCMVYGVPAPLFQDLKGATRDNLKTYTRSGFTQGIMPMVQRFADKFNSHWAWRFGEGIYIEPYIEEIQELQADRAEQASTLAQIHWMTGNEKREQMGLDPDPMLESYLIPSNLVPVEMAGAGGINDYPQEAVENAKLANTGDLMNLKIQELEPLTELEYGRIYDRLKHKTDQKKHDAWGGDAMLSYIRKNHL